MSTNRFVHTHVHTEFSLLDGLSEIKKLVKHAKSQDMSSLAITDHGAMFGVIDFYRAAKEAEIKPIIGMESYLAPRKMTDREPMHDKKPFHLLLLAKNQQGYQNLLKIASRSQLEGYYYRPRIDWDTLQEYSEGLVVTSGCLAARIPQLVAKGQDAEAREWVGRFQEVFGAENFYLELQQHDIPEIEVLNKWLVDYRKSGHTPVGLLATNDVHYVRREDFDAHDMLLCIQTGASIKQPKRKDHDNEDARNTRMAMSDNSYYLNSPDEMWQIWGEKFGVPEAVHNSVKIAEMCDVNLDTEGYHLPVFPVPPGFDAPSYVRYLCEKGLEWRYGDDRAHNDPVLRERLDYELGVINRMGFDTYFLIVWDLTQFAAHADIWWNVRGSGAGSLVAYCMGITMVDPIQNDLLFERFLNPGRVSMPDIDIDFPDDRRGEMIAYSALKYGEDKVAAIITFGTMGAKAAIKDVARAMEVDLTKVSKAVGLIPTEAKQKAIEEYVELNPDLKKMVDEDVELQQVINMAKQLQGINRHSSVHAAGVIIADRPLDEYLPLHRVTGKDPSEGALKAVTQFPMETCESLGLLKVDFLGLSTLTIMRRACESIERFHGIDYNLSNIPYRHDDPHITDEQRDMLDNAFELMGRGETIGVFQLESTGMQSMLRDMRPNRFAHIVAGVALYRPGPMDFIPLYNRRMHGEEGINYLHDKLVPILEETYGIITYQEQIMQVAGQLFGYELGEADLMRKAVSKKKEKDLAKHRGIFVERGPKYGVSEEVASKIFDEIEFFANYGFNRAHATDYAMVTVQTAYLKAHYPEEYMMAMLSTHRDDSVKIAHFLDECRRMNIPILPPDVNYSALDFDIQQQVDGRRGIRFGLAGIKNAGEAAMAFVVRGREADDGGAFQSIEDFCRRVDLRSVGKRALESLIKVGAMEKFGNRSQLLAGIDRVISFSSNYHKDREIGRVSLFGDETGTAEDLFGNLPNVKEPPYREILGWEKELLGLYVTGRPTDKFRDDLAQMKTETIADLKTEDGKLKHDKTVTIAGEIINIRKVYTQKGDAMAILQIEDWHDTVDSIEVVMFPRNWAKIEALVANEELPELKTGEVVKIIGKLDSARDRVQVIGESLTQNFTVMDKSSDQNYQSRYQDESWMLPPEPDFVDIGIPAPVVAVSNTVHKSGVNGTNGHTNGGNGRNNGNGNHSAYAPVTPTVSTSSMPDFDLNYEGRTPAEAWSPEPGDSYDPFDEDAEAQVPPRCIVLSLKRTDDLERDQRVLKRLYGTLIKHPGRDRFVIMIEVKGKEYIMDFNNTSTDSWSEELRTDLEKMGDTVKWEIYDEA
ncbi:MAG TPA: DNA polymerase III subunit alpha [Phototrophicaceae bacterium]|jgi:DNA polymerase-3 subunit alpha|nr:DNA polymerase III subunit alpha [Phototrophicaceae bacterium]